MVRKLEDMVHCVVCHGRCGTSRPLHIWSVGWTIAHGHAVDDDAPEACAMSAHDQRFGHLHVTGKTADIALPCDC